MASVPVFERPKNGSVPMSANGSNVADVLMNLLHSQDCGRSNLTASTSTTSAADMMVRIVVDVCIVGLLCLIGFIGNTLTFIILRGDRDKNSTTNWLLQTLAVVDIVYLVACLFIQPVKAIHDLYPETEWRRGSGWSAFHITFTNLEPYIWPLASIAQTVTVWVVVLVTVDRYIAICMPLRSKIRTLPRAHAAVAIVIISAILYNIPLFFEKTVLYEKTCDGGRYTIRLDKTELRRSVSYFVIYRTICYFVFRTIGPLLLLVVLNARLIRALRQMRRRHRYLTRRNQQRENVTLTLVVVVSVFIACELPDVCLRIAVTLKELVPSVELDDHAVRYRITAVTNALITLNSAANFFIYCLIGHKFRRILVRMCRTGCCGRYYVGGAGGGSRRQNGSRRAVVGHGLERLGEGDTVRDEENGLFTNTPQPSMSTRMSIAMTTCNNQTVVLESATRSADTSHLRYI